MIKLFGIALIFTASCTFGIIASARIKRIIRHRNAILELLKFIRINILHGETPLCEIFSSFKNKELEECGFCDLLRQKENDSLCYALENCNELKISESERDRLLMFASRLGKTCFAETEITLCDKYISLLGDEFKNKNTISEQRATLFVKLSPLCGLFLAVLLL